MVGLTPYLSSSGYDDDDNDDDDDDDDFPKSKAQTISDLKPVPSPCSNRLKRYRKLRLPHTSAILKVSFATMRTDRRHGPHRANA